MQPCIAAEIQEKLEAEYAKRRTAGLKRGNEKPEPRSAKICGTGESRIEAAKKAGVNHQYVSDAKRIRKASPGTFEDVKAGKLGIQEAKRKLTPPPAKRIEDDRRACLRVRGSRGVR